MCQKRWFQMSCLLSATSVFQVCWYSAWDSPRDRHSNLGPDHSLRGVFPAGHSGREGSTVFLPPLGPVHASCSHQVCYGPVHYSWWGELLVQWCALWWVIKTFDIYVTISSIFISSSFFPFYPHSIVPCFAPPAAQWRCQILWKLLSHVNDDPYMISIKFGVSSSKVKVTVTWSINALSAL